MLVKPGYAKPFGGVAVALILDREFYKFRTVQESKNESDIASLLTVYTDVDQGECGESE